MKKWCETNPIFLLKSPCNLHVICMQMQLVRQPLKTILEALIWRISLVKKKVFAFKDKPMMLFNYLFVEVNSSKQFKALILTISLVIYVFYYP